MSYDPNRDAIEEWWTAAYADAAAKYPTAEESAVGREFLRRKAEEETVAWASPGFGAGNARTEEEEEEAWAAASAAEKAAEEAYEAWQASLPVTG